jgi:hypothetical protein
MSIFYLNCVFRRRSEALSMPTFPLICPLLELESRIWGRDVLFGPEGIFNNFQEKFDDGFWCFQLVRNPWEVLRNPDLRLNAHYYITKVNLARDRCCLSGFHRQIHRVGKNPVFFFLKKPAQWVFLGFFGFFWVFLGFLVFLGFFGFFCPDERVFRVFCSFTNTLRCIQTLNYNHSY